MTTTIVGDPVTVLLDQWGRYCRQTSPVRLGYPTKAVFALPSAGRGGRVFNLDAEAESRARQTDRILVGLKQFDPQAFRALEQIYLWQTSAVEAAARLGVSRNTFYGFKSKGEAYLAGAVSAVG